MPELRHDPIQRRWVIISTERGRRPTPSRQGALDDPGPAGCPFCPGNESKTPPEISAWRHGTAKDAPGWEVRVVPNKFPALAIEGTLDRRGVGMYDRINGVGAHEVIIEGPRHDREMADSPIEQIVKVFRIYRDRLVDLKRDHRLRYVLIFKNSGAAAGASLVHPHSQVIATPVTPRTLAIELRSAKEHFQVKERCLYCDIAAQEIEARTRVVYRNEHFVTWCPYASRFPFETCVMPLRHQHDFSMMDDAMIVSLAAAIKDLLQRLRHGLADPAFNFLIHTAPNLEAGVHRAGRWDTIEHDFHWHVEILPRLTGVAGFEWGSGFYINPTVPEEAAAALREVEIP